MRVKVNLRPALAGWALAVVAVAAFVSSAGTAQAEPLGDGGKVRLLYNEAGTNSFIPFTIRKFGLDKKHGFELVPVPTTTTAAGITAMKAGAGDVHTYGWNDIARMNNSGIPVVGVAPFLRWGADFILVSKDSPIKTIGDLKGKKVGTSARTALNWVAMMALGDKKYQLTEKDMTIHEGAPPLLRALLEQGSLDATHMFNSVTPSMIVSGKSRVLAKVSDLVSGFGMPDTPFLLYAFDTKYVAAKP
jgi:NitT/TauT family transport system substrate-binding protein